ncbi:MAG: hypothetical protein ACLFT6_06215 [Bacteroidales bacterium]
MKEVADEFRVNIYSTDINFLQAFGTMESRLILICRWFNSPTWVLLSLRHFPMRMRVFVVSHTKNKSGIRRKQEKKSPLE